MDANELRNIIESHRKWLRNEGGRRANLHGANLHGANLHGADLTGANLSEANLSRANLSRANLSEANLSRADLSEANLSEANLSEADLSEANLSWANLSEANLSGANLSGATLSRANLTEADLSGATVSCKTKWPPPSAILFACWGSVSAGLGRRLMAHDAANHPNPEAFSRWALGGGFPCPYVGCFVQRSVNFTEDHRLWTDDLLTLRESALALAQDLIREKCIYKQEESK